MGFTCKDCKYYLPVDVFKGICKLTKDHISPDDKSCKEFEKEKKCKFCANFKDSDSKEFLGSCMRKYDACPDMNAKRCADFDWNR